MATRENFEHIQGDNFRLNLTYYSPSGSVINLSGYSAVLEVRDQPGGQLLCTTASIGSIPSSGSYSGLYISTPSASSGTLVINLPGTETANFNYPRSSYQIRVQSSGGIKDTLVHGWISVDAGTISI